MDRRLVCFPGLTGVSFLEYETVERHYAYANPKDLLTKQHPNILLLDTCAMTQSLLDRMLIQVEQHIETDPGWADMAVSLQTSDRGPSETS